MNNNCIKGLIVGVFLIFILNSQVIAEQKALSTEISKTEPNGPSFRVEKILFTGNTVISSKELSKFSRLIEGKDIYFQDLMDLTDKVTRYYHEKGYVTSNAYIPTQKVKDNVIKIAIDEGSYASIEINGNKWSKKEYLENILSSNGVKVDKVLNVYELDHSIKEINNHNYMQGKINVGKAGCCSNNAVITLDVKDRFPLDFSTGWNNEGQELTGEQLATVQASYNNITGKGETAAVGAMLGSGTLGIFTAYSEPLDEKTRITTSYSYGNSSFGGVFKEFDIFGNTHSFNTTVTRKLRRGKHWSLDADIGLEAKNSATKMGLFDIDLSEYRMRALVTGITAQRKDNSGMWLSRMEARTGLPVCNATEISENLGYADSKYLKGEVNLRRYQKLPLNLVGIVKSDFQLSPNKLLPPEKMILGGSSSVRGYDPMILSGDSGFNASVEIRKKLPFIDDLLPVRLKHLKGKFQIGGFYDCGYVFDAHRGYNPIHTNFLQSAGVSFYVPVTKFITAQLNLGMPIGPKIFSDKNMKFSFNLTTDFHNFWSKDMPRNKL